MPAVNQRVPFEEMNSGLFKARKKEAVNPLQNQMRQTTENRLNFFSQIFVKSLADIEKRLYS